MPTTIIQQCARLFLVKYQEERSNKLTEIRQNEQYRENNKNENQREK